MIARHRPRRLFLARAFVPLLALVAALALAGSLALGLGTSRAAPEEPGPAGVPPPLPDLTIQYLELTLETGADCDFASTELGVRIHFANIGDADAGPFDVDVNDVRMTQIDGLAAGAKASLWFGPPFIFLNNPNKGFVDAEEEVGESNETNNHFEGLLAIPTLPPTCTATPSVTPTPTATPDRPEILGDVDCDFAVTALDALLVLQYVAGLIEDLPCPDAADVSLDGETTAVDATIILQVVAGLIGLI